MRQTHTVLCFGDSNTYGAIPTLTRNGRHRFSADRRWTGVMARQLGPSWHVIEEGHPGRTTVHSDPIEGRHKNGLASLPVCLETHMPLDAVVIMLGTNDLKTRFSVTAGDIADSLGAIVQAVQMSAVGLGGNAPKILVVSPPPIAEVDWFAEMFAGGTEKSVRLAPLVSKMCERRGVAFLDAGSIIEVSAVDGIHLDVESHKTLGIALAHELKKLLSS